MAVDITRAVLEMKSCQGFLTHTIACCMCVVKLGNPNYLQNHFPQ